MYALIRQYEGVDAKTRQTATHKANDEPVGNDGAVTSISVFNSRAEAEASGKVAQEWVDKNLPDMTKPHHVAGELVAH
jgi:hypothetical protein